MFTALHLPTISNISTCLKRSAANISTYTEASVERLRRAGYNAGFMPLEAAVHQYVTGYLNRDDRYR